MAGAEQAAPAAAREQQPECRGGALSLAGPGGREQEVPKTLPQAAATFCSHPSTILILAGLGALLWARVQQPLHPVTDAAVAAAVAGGWCLQEWAVHALLLHSKFDWVGRRIHVGHHQRPYFHVSIDDPPIVVAFMAASLGLFWLGFHGSELALTAAISYFAMGLLYEWTHYIVHTRYVPRSALGKRIRMHHMLHHTRHEGYWLAFTVPEVDSLFGTNPEPSAVRMSDMARASLKSARGGGSSS